MSNPPVLLDFSAPADDAEVLDVLKWMVAVMDRDDKALMFTASVLAQCVKWGGSITERQGTGVEKIYARLRTNFDNGVLAIQGGGLGEDDGSQANVTHLRVASRRGK